MDLRFFIASIVPLDAENSGIIGNCFMLIPVSYRLVFHVTPKQQVYLLRDLHIESLPACFSGFQGHRRAPHQKLQKLHTKPSMSSSLIYAARGFETLMRKRFEIAPKVFFDG